MHENDKKNIKRTGRHYNNPRKDYVDSFQWGFVDGGDGEPASNSGDRVQKTVKREPKDQKSPGKKIPVAKRTSVPARDALDEIGLKLPSYGRTPIPTDEELTLIEKKQRDSAVREPFKEQKPKKAAVERTPSKVSSKPAPPVSRPSVVKPPLPDTKPPFTTETLARREKKVQMVWDPEKREYVPLVVVRKESERREEPKPRREPERYKETEPLISDVSVSARIPKEKRVPKSKPVSRTMKVPVAEHSSKTEPDSLPKKNPVHRQERAERPQKPERLRKSHSERPVSVQRGDIPPLVESNLPDPADVESESRGFAELGVSEAMLEALKIVRYLEPTPIQAGVFKQVKAGTDVMGQARTGTGKTAAFLIPIIDGIEECPPGNDPVALILVPTRELAVQVRDEAARLSYERDVRTTACYGGKPLAKQIERLRSGIDIVVGTPGRVLDLMNRRALSLDTLKWVVLDEADRMLDIGFRPDIEKILRRTPKDRQTLLFSATLPQPVVRLAEKYMNAPEILDFSPQGVAVDTIEQFYVTVDVERKFEALFHLLEQEQPRQAIIFTRTKRGADRLSRLLSRRLDSIAAIHGDLSQDQRDKVMGKFRDGTLRYLVATDVVGRGIDVSGISHIINYDIPAFCDDYVHRVGRTGRMGREGVAYTFVTVQEGSELTRIEMRIEKLLQRAELKGFETFAKPEPDFEKETSPPPETKPVYGKRVRRIRRAL